MYTPLDQINLPVFEKTPEEQVAQLLVAKASLV